MGYFCALIYIFHLRDNLYWNDGTKLTAQDFEYAWKRVLDPNTASENAYMMYPLNNGEEFFKQEVSIDDVGVKAIDDKTLYVKLKAPVTYFLKSYRIPCVLSCPSLCCRKSTLKFGLLMIKLCLMVHLCLRIGYIPINYNS